MNTGPARPDTCRHSGYRMLSVLLAAAATLNLNSCASLPQDDAASAARQPRIWPDYTALTIPAQIAPLNFVIEEPGERFVVRMQAHHGPGLTCRAGRDGRVRIAQRAWRRMLKSNHGTTFTTTVFARNQGEWRRFEPYTTTIASDTIDSHIAYRKLFVNYNWYRAMGTYQRDLRGYREDEILQTRNFKDGCFNCHTFCNRDPSTFFLHVRSRAYGSCALYATRNHLNKIDTKLGYTSWHSDTFATLSLNKTRQCMHALGTEMRDIMDLNSALVNYSFTAQATGTIAAFADPAVLETYPCWAPDGRHLYFCSAPMLWVDNNEVPFDTLSSLRYSIQRIEYDPQHNTWSAIETLVHGDSVGRSATLPRVSPDNRWLVFCLNDYGPSPHMRTNGDLFIMDLATRAVRELTVNTPHAESWHSWSGNSRWLAFSSKAQDGMYTRIHLCHIDTAGYAAKSFPLPQRDPTRYRRELNTYSVPEFISGPVTLSQRALMKTIRSKKAITVDLPVSAATPSKTGPAWSPQRE